MLDTMTFTKILGGFCGALLIYLLGSWAAEEMYHTGGGHGHGEHDQAYVIEVEDAEPEGEEEVVEVDVVALITEADAAKGAKVFNKCKSCHKLEDGANGTGPTLFGVVNRSVAAIDGFGYSSAATSHGGAWGYEELYAFLENPKGYMPGTKMTFAGLRKSADRANLIAYLETVK